MYMVKKAIIMAAGEGKRMRPLTYKTPKPLIEVNGRIMIETIIEGLFDNGISDIYVVVGYLREQFFYLEKKYAGLKIIENPYYAKSNNISSLYAAREHLGECIILDGDQVIKNKAILRKEFEKSGYNAVWTEEYTPEWLLNVEGESVIDCSRTGGSGGWQLYSISRWNMEDGLRLRKHLEQEFEVNDNKDIYWDDIALFCYPDEYDLGIMSMNKEDVIEVDSIDELKSIDTQYEEINIGGKE